MTDEAACRCLVRFTANAVAVAACLCCINSGCQPTTGSGTPGASGQPDSKVVQHFEGGLVAQKDNAVLRPEQIKQLLKGLPQWKSTEDGKQIRREWVVKDFVTALDFFTRVGRIAEQQDHHPDLHLTGYRNVAIELSTHEMNGLTEKDFVLATMIEKLPVELKK